MKAIKLSVIVQIAHEQEVRDALARAGAGKVGNYNSCQFVTYGEAQFKPNRDANPTIGDKASINVVPAAQIQTWCTEDEVGVVIKEVRKAHPNEEPAIELIPFELR